MQAHTKKHLTDDVVTITLQVHRSHVSLVRRYVKTIEEESSRKYTIEEVFPEYVGKDQQIALRAYRNRENLTQKQLSELTGISQHHISEMEHGKRTIGKELAKRLAKALNCDYQRFL